MDGAGVMVVPWSEQGHLTGVHSLSTVPLLGLVESRLDVDVALHSSENLKYFKDSSAKYLVQRGKSLN